MEIVQIVDRCPKEGKAVLSGRIAAADGRKEAAARNGEEKNERRGRENNEKNRRR